MNLLNRYLFQQYIKFFLTISGAFVALYLLVDFLEKYDNFRNAGQSLFAALKYFALVIPFIFDQLGPIFILLTGVVTLGIASHTNELTALKAGGVPLYLVIRPLIYSSLIFTAFFLFAAEFILPATIAQTNKIWNEDVRGKVMLGIMRSNRYYYKGKDGFYSFNRPDTEKYVFQNFSFSQWDKNHNIQTLTTAKSATWNDSAHKWVLENGQIQRANKTGDYDVTNFSQLETTFPEQPQDFLVSTDKIAELSLTSLIREMNTTDIEREKHEIWTTFLGRISYLTLGVPLLLLGLPTLLYSYRKWGRDLSIAVPISCGLAFLAWGVWQTLQSLAFTGYISPLLAAGSLHLALTLIGIFFLIKNDR
ncbi:MAG: permease [Deltaproteobacteria bacterium]|nr:MAG: permease [Deltaproteobacteria bacterium]